jgi:Tfp pilus assembly protein PilZ
MNHYRTLLSETQLTPSAGGSAASGYRGSLDVLKMRRYIRHPSGVPIKFSVANTHGEDDSFRAFALRDVSEGGLCFCSQHPIAPGSTITIEIPIESPPFEAKGQVAWCRPEGNGYAVGVQFNDDFTRFSVRMVEQVCYIERYRAEVLDKEGRELTSDEAAQEWVERFAGEFPGCG